MFTTEAECDRKPKIFLDNDILDFRRELTTITNMDTKNNIYKNNKDQLMLVREYCTIL